MQRRASESRRGSLGTDRRTESPNGQSGIPRLAGQHCSAVGPLWWSLTATIQGAVGPAWPQPECVGVRLLVAVILKALLGGSSRGAPSEFLEVLHLLPRTTLSHKARELGFTPLYRLCAPTAHGEALHVHP